MNMAHETHVHRFREQAVGYQRKEGVGEGAEWGWRYKLCAK